MGRDGGEIQRICRSRGKGGRGKEGGDGASTNIVASLGSEGKGCGGEKWIAPQGKAGHQVGAKRGGTGE